MDRREMGLAAAGIAAGVGLPQAIPPGARGFTVRVQGSRAAWGLSQHEAAKCAGLPLAVWRAWETGAIDFPGTKALAAARAIGAALRWLYDGDA